MRKHYAVSIGWVLVLALVVGGCKTETKNQSDSASAPLHPSLFAPEGATNVKPNSANWESDGFAALSWETAQTDREATDHIVQHLAGLKYKRLGPPGRWIAKSGDWWQWRTTWEAPNGDNVVCTILKRPKKEVLAAGCEVFKAALVKELAKLASEPEVFDYSVELKRCGSAVQILDSNTYSGLGAMSLVTDACHGLIQHEDCRVRWRTVTSTGGFRSFPEVVARCARAYCDNLGPDKPEMCTIQLDAAEAVNYPKAQELFTRILESDLKPNDRELAARVMTRYFGGLQGWAP